MTDIIAAQIFGLLGYIIYICAPQCKTQKTIVQLGIVGYFFLSLQWYLLAQPALIVTNIIALTTSTYALAIKKRTDLGALSPLLYFLALVSILLVSNGGVIDILCMSAALLSIRSILSKDLKSFRTYAIGAGIFLTIAGALAASIPALIFNILFTVSHIQKHAAARTKTPSFSDIKNAPAKS